MRTGRVLTCFAVLAMSASGARAQSSPKPEIHFDPATGVVTLKMLPQDSAGHLIPDIRRDSFAVYENGARQQNASVEIEHAPITLAVVMEWGGRYQALNAALYDDVPRAAHQLLKEIGRQDRIAIWTYGNRVQSIADFSKGHDALGAVLLNLNEPESPASIHSAGQTMWMCRRRRASAGRRST